MKKYISPMLHGFTLPEVMVTVVVLLILGSVATVSVSRVLASGAIDRSARSLISDIKKAQTMALAGVESTGVSPFQYGIYFDRADPDGRRYILYANQDDAPNMDGTAMIDTNPTSDDQVEILGLNETSVAFDFSAPDLDQDDFIAFTVPSGRVEGRTSNLRIVLTGRGGSSRVIIVDFVSGLVYEE